MKGIFDQFGAPATVHTTASDNRDQLRFMTCGSVDDGKSTLIGRLLYDASLISEDQLRSLDSDSKSYGTTGNDVDVALLLDGLESEREQGITIDVAYRYFRTARRRFIVADTPGHEQYTRNMITGASTSELAVLLVDARKGLLSQTRRHAYIAALLGIRDVVLAVNKIDLVAFDQYVFDQISYEFVAFVERFKFSSVTAIPTSARIGDNIVRPSTQMPWYSGPTLLQYLETIDVDSGRARSSFRMSVQLVNRPNADFRGFSGTVAGGQISPGASIVVMRSGKTSQVDRIVTFDGDIQIAKVGDAVTLTLRDEIDISRGDMLSGLENRPAFADAFSAHLVWLADEPLSTGRSYLLKSGCQMLSATVTEIKHRIDINDMGLRAARTIRLNEIAEVKIATAYPIAFDSYDENRETGSFVLVDRIDNSTVGAGMIQFALRRGTNLFREDFTVTKKMRAAQKGQKPVLLWLTGLSGAGKSTIANLIERKLTALGKHTFLLDGDNVRHGLNKDLGFVPEDRVENIRRAAEVAKLFVDSGLIVLVAFISPFRAERRMARDLVEPGEFIEIFVDASLDVCEKRDPKNLYQRARSGDLPNFTGIDSPYEAPDAPEIHLDSSAHDPESLADRVVKYLEDGGFLSWR